MLEIKSIEELKAFQRFPQGENKLTLKDEATLEIEKEKIKGKTIFTGRVFFKYKNLITYKIERKSKRLNHLLEIMIFKFEQRNKQMKGNKND